MNVSAIELSRTPAAELWPSYPRVRFLLFPNVPVSRKIKHANELRSFCERGNKQAFFTFKMYGLVFTAKSLHFRDERALRESEKTSTSSALKIVCRLQRNSAIYLILTYRPGSWHTILRALSTSLADERKTISTASSKATFSAVKMDAHPSMTLTSPYSLVAFNLELVTIGKLAFSFSLISLLS